MSIVRRTKGAADYDSLLKVQLNSYGKELFAHYSNINKLPTFDQIRRQVNELDHPDNLLIAQYNHNIIGFVYVNNFWKQMDGTNVFQIEAFTLPEYRNIQIELIRIIEKQIKGRLGINRGSLVYVCSAIYDLDINTYLLKEGFIYSGSKYQMLLANIKEQIIPEIQSDFALEDVKPEYYKLVIRELFNNYAGSLNSTILDEKIYNGYINSTHFDPTLWQVLWTDNKIAGFIINDIFGNVGNISELLVKEEYRRQGLAKYLMGNSINALRNRGAKQISLQVVENNSYGAENLYSSFGFIKTHKTNKYVKTIQ